MRPEDELADFDDGEDAGRAWADLADLAATWRVTAHVGRLIVRRISTPPNDRDAGSVSDETAALIAGRELTEESRAGLWDRLVGRPDPSDALVAGFLHGASERTFELAGRGARVAATRSR